MSDDFDENDLAAQIVAALERSRTTSANVLRDKTYRLLGKLGLDVVKLVGDARTSYSRELKRRVERSTRRKQLLQLRLKKAKVPEEKLLSAQNALARAPKTIAGHRRALQQVLHRPAVGPTDPTLERRRHSPEPPTEEIIVPGQGPVKPTIAHRFDWLIDQVRELLTESEYEAADRYYFAYYSRISHAKTSAYDGAGDQRDPATRLPLTPTHQRAGREWDMWSRRVPYALRPILDNFVLGIPPRAALQNAARRNAFGQAIRDGLDERAAHIAGQKAWEAVRDASTPDKPFSRVEFGRIYGRCSGAHQARGASDGAIKVALGVLAAIWSDYQEYLDTQRARVAEAAEQNERIRDLIARGALSEAVREIQAETRAAEARAAQGVNAGIALHWAQSYHTPGPVRRRLEKRLERKATSN